MAEPRECKGCKEVRGIVGRGLCNYCYKSVTKLGQLDLFPIGEIKGPFVDIRIDQDGDKIKQCTRCKEWKKLTLFRESTQSAHGYESWCKKCRAVSSGERYAPKKKAIRQKKSEVYEDGLKKCKKCEQFKSVDNFTAHPTHWDKLSHVCRQCTNQYTQENYQINRDKLLEQSRVWYERNKDRRRQKDKEWRRNNLDKSRAIWHRYKTRKMEAEGDFTVEQWEALKSYYSPDGSCLDCGEKRGLTYDHVIPLSKGGSNYIGNMQPLCGNCNSKKGRWHTTDFRPDKGEFARSLMVNQ